MKRVIEIDEKMYETLAWMRKCDDLGAYYNAIADSKPLNEVLDKISEEVEKKSKGNLSLYNKAINDVLDIINKYRESEGK